MMKTFTFILVLVVLTAGRLAAQPEVVMDVVNHQAAQLIDSTMNTINLRAEVFNEEISKVNKLRPLDVENMTQAKIQTNVPIIKAFLSYLEVYRATSDREKARIADSVTSLRSYLPKSKQKKFLKEFSDAYTLDQESFYKYTLALTDLYKNIVTLLEFMQTAKVEIKNDKITFGDKKEYEQYEKILAQVEKYVKRQGKAGLASQKAAMEAGEIMQKTYGKLQH